MKKIVVLFLALALLLTACAAPTPITVVVTATAEPVVATDVPAPTDVPTAVSVAPTDTAAPAAPTDTAVPAVVPTETAAPVEATATVAAGPTATNTKPPAVGGSVFTELTRDIDAFSLKCAPSQLHFTAKTTNTAITKVTLYYRVIDKSSTLPAGAMVNSKDMLGDKKGNFTLEFSALDVNPDLRLANGWFEYQFVGLNKTGDRVGSSDKIVKQVTFTLECP